MATHSTRVMIKSLLSVAGILYQILFALPVWLFLVWQILKTIEITPVIMVAFFIYGINSVLSTLITHFTKRTLEEVKYEESKKEAN